MKLGDLTIECTITVPLIATTGERDGSEVKVTVRPDWSHARIEPVPQPGDVVEIGETA